MVPYDYLPEHPAVSNRKGVIWCHVKGEVVAATPKVASTTIRKVSEGQIPKDKVEMYPECVVFVRDPLERMESAFHYFNVRRGSWPVVWDARTQSYRQNPPASWPDFVDKVLDGKYWDKHWVPQTWLWGPLPTLTFLFEDIETVAKDRWGLTIGHHNRGPVNGEPVRLSYRVPELEDFFKDDLELRRDLELPFC
jgi:hypothetical protein